MNDIPKLKFAEEYIDNAIYLLTEKNSPASCCHLSGAAEELLGNMLKAKRKTYALNNLWKLFDNEPFKKFYKWKTFKDFNNTMNHTKNSIKHYDNVKDSSIYNDNIEFEAAFMVIRSACNFFALTGDQHKSLKKFEGWFYREWIGNV